MRAVRMCSGRKPASTCDSAQKLRIMSPAAITSRTASATWAIASELNKSWRVLGNVRSGHTPNTACKYDSGQKLRFMSPVAPANTPRLAEVHIDWRVLVFTGTLTMLTGVIFGLAPALHSARAALTEALKSGGRGTSVSVSQRLRSSLAIAQVALAVLLVSAAGL